MPELIQDLPMTRSDERMHILGTECWCEPWVDGEYLRHNGPSMTDEVIP